MAFDEALPDVDSRAFYLTPIIMKKDAYYFPHFSNSRSDSKILKLRRVLGIEGYGIYFMLLEVLREQTNWKFPINGIDDLAFEFHTSREKIMAVITNFELFSIDEKEMFFSPKLILYLQPWVEKSKRARNAALRRWDNINEKEQKELPNDANAMQMQCGGNAFAMQIHTKNDANAMQMHTKNDANAMQMQCGGNANAMQMQCAGNAKKGKEKKGKEKKGKEIKNILEELEINLEFEPIIEEWLEYKKDRKESYKSDKSVHAFIKKLHKLSNNAPHQAQEIIEQSIANNWAGIFELKNQNNRSPNQKNNWAGTAKIEYGKNKRVI
jgi:hypothetical protein